MTEPCGFRYEDLIMNEDGSWTGQPACDAERCWLKDRGFPFRRVSRQADRSTIGPHGEGAGQAIFTQAGIEIATTTTICNIKGNVNNLPHKK